MWSYLVDQILHEREKYNANHDDCIENMFNLKSLRSDTKYLYSKFDKELAPNCSGVVRNTKIVVDRHARYTKTVIIMAKET